MSENKITLKNGMQMPRLGMGTWMLGEHNTIYQQELKALRAGMDAGFTLIDTAEMYGNGLSEQLIGEAIQGYNREKLFLVSKVYPYNAGRPAIYDSIDQTLCNLKTDYLDLYLLHWRGSIPLEETVDSMEELVKKGEKVKAFCYYNSFNSCGWIDSLAPEIRSEIEIFMGDIRDPNGVRTAMQGQERVFHLAALIAIPFSYHSPDSYVDTNIKGTLNVLQAARDLGTQRLMVTSTSEVYGTAQYVPIDEKHPYQGQSPYSATKIGADRLAESFYRSFDVPLSIVRPFNTYGPRQSARAVIPTIITQLLAGRTEIRLGSLAPTRDFNYVKDTAAGFMAIADCDAAVGQEINIATGREISIGDLADELIRQINPEARVVCEAERLRPGKSEVERLLGDASKLRALTGWQPAYTFEQGLAQTIEWLRGNMDGYKVDAYNL